MASSKKQVEVLNNCNECINLHIEKNSNIFYCNLKIKDKNIKKLPDSAIVKFAKNCIWYKEKK